MLFALSTRWNAYRHHDGTEMIKEIISLGFRHVELGYDLTQELVPGVMNMVESRRVTVTSVHNYCPVPPFARKGHPELFELSSINEKEVRNAIRFTTRTLEFASQVNAGFAVVHAGNVHMRQYSRDLIALTEKGKTDSPKYERLRQKLISTRERKIKRHLEALHFAIESLIPAIEDTGVKIALENLPSWESIPSEDEMLFLLRKFGEKGICYWHDTGHGQIRQNLEINGHRMWFNRLLPWMKGMHIHDVKFPAMDHIMPPQGDLDFKLLNPSLAPDTALVIEPAPGLPAEDIKKGLETLNTIWQNNIN